MSARSAANNSNVAKISGWSAAGKGLRIRQLDDFSQPSTVRTQTFPSSGDSAGMAVQPHAM
ncbi:MAG: hypothetical protein JW829_04270 [Pirellulales bacterium]|nr:hypothetical protein [Pirellulales bacterium]